MENQIMFREIRKEDYNDIAEIISKTWEYEKFSSPHIAKAMAELFLSSCLKNQNFTCVALYQGKPAGVIMANSFQDKVKKWRHSWMQGKSIIKMAFSHEGRGVMKLFAGFEHIDRELLKNSGKKYDGELALFAVNSTERGLGIGGVLYQRAMEYFQGCGVENFYLYTDTACNYEFYEYKGMKKAGEKFVSFKPYADKEMTFFLFDKTCI